jgi:hypothetical protein
MLFKRLFWCRENYDQPQHSNGQMTLTSCTLRSGELLRRYSGFGSGEVLSSSPPHTRRQRRGNGAGIDANIRRAGVCERRVG